MTSYVFVILTKALAITCAVWGAMWFAVWLVVRFDLANVFRGLT